MNMPLIKPVITEKSMSEASSGWYTFLVARHSNKRQIADAVSKEFNVHVTDVKTLVIAGKRKRRGKRGLTVVAPDKKKAYVKLKKGETIELFGVEAPKKLS